MEQEKLKLLKSLHLLDQIPEDQLSTLEKFLKPSSLKELCSFSLLIIILLFRPAGLFGKRTQ